MGSVVWSRPEQLAPVHSTDESIESSLPLNHCQNGEENSSQEGAATNATRMDEFRDSLEQQRSERAEVISRITQEMNDLRGIKEDLEKERTLRAGLEKQITALKEVSVVSNEMLQLREVQVVELKKRLQGMETAAEETLTTLRNQYEIQIANIRKLRQLYEERAEATARGHQKEIEKERAKSELLELKLDEYMKDAAIAKSLKDKADELEKRLEEQEDQMDRLKDERASFMAESNNLTSQLSIINTMFSNILTGETDFDSITQLLQDNHNLIADLIAHGDINDTAALLVNLAGRSSKNTDTSTADTNALVAVDPKAEIASNLPKMWRMLVELLSNYENSTQVQGSSNECYKNVKTASGQSRTVISVSQTFLRLKDLILEKNSLVKEVGRLKTLNGHLENRLDLQEKRLGVVTSELRKTWGVVSKLKVQHRQLHTHEKVLRYELQHKRQMLADLKHELKYCKETWDKAREKNKETEHDWELLRKEFSLRKSRDASNSAESGYEDDESSQSPDISTSELEDDEISPLSDERQIADLNLDLEDAASDATVIELIDMLDFEQDEVPPYEENSLRNESIDDSETSLTDAATVDDRECLEKETDSTDGVREDDGSEEGGSTTDPLSDEVLDARSARLKRLEQQCRSLLNQMAITSLRSDTLSTRLEELHEQYRSEEGRRSLMRQNAEIESSTKSASASETEDDRSLPEVRESHTQPFVSEGESPLSNEKNPTPRSVETEQSQFTGEELPITFVQGVNSLSTDAESSVQLMENDCSLTTKSTHAEKESSTNNNNSESENRSEESAM